MENSEILTTKRGRKPLTEEQRARKREAKRAERLRKRQASMKERAAEFWKQLIPYIGTYGKNVIDRFYLFYTEPNKHGTKMTFELCRTFDLKTRLDRWYWYLRFRYERNPKYKPQPNYSGTMSSAESAKLRETLSKSEERERRWEQQRQEAVTYEQYLAMKEQGDIKQPELPT